ncbi:MAG: type II toxin-antitoxin system RelE/ParE family toxin [Sphingomonas sp.]
MARIELSNAADADLEQISEYGRRTFGDAVADAYMESLRRALALLSEYPRSGVAHDDIVPAIHSLPCCSHRIYYDIDGERVIVQRVLHKAMDPRRWLD